jgi:KEOPS complex subunit Pcc1
VKAKAILRLKFSSEKHLEIVFNALTPEVEKPATVRSKTVLDMEKGFLILKVGATDAVALRAAINSYLRWINSTVNVLEFLEDTS